ncbi:MAG TPA: hypothetical protein VHR66_03980 [Gemmataceae bacterium]|jgi:hypothetical protein|nr:hypothetical protein [Gemmataceae bacterium]
MFYQTESKAQGWRAMAKMEDGQEALLLIGRSSTQVRQGYLESFNDLLDDEEREAVVSISLQRWHGAPDAGTWEHQTTLKVPATAARVARFAA